MNTPNAIVYIRENSSGRVVRFEDFLHTDENDKPILFIWTEDGNWGCDCNRSLFFYRKLDRTERWDIGCSDGKYSVNIYSLDESMLYLGEFEQTLEIKEKNVR